MWIDHGALFLSGNFAFKCSEFWSSNPIFIDSYVKDIKKNIHVFHNRCYQSQSWYVTKGNH